MNRIVQHVPAFVDIGDERPKEGVFDSLEQLLAIPFVKVFSDESDFHQFSTGGGMLLAEQQGGRRWWVVGRLEKPVDGLQSWSKGIYQCVGKDGQPIDVPGTEVSYSVGDKVGLKSGQILKRWGR